MRCRVSWRCVAGARHGHDGCMTWSFVWTTRLREGDGTRLLLHLLVEDLLGLRFGQGVPVGYGFDGRAARGPG